MHVTAEQQHNAGAKLWSIANDFREMNPALDQKLAFKLALLANPKTAEIYLGSPVRQDARNEALRIVVNYQPPR